MKINKIMTVMLLIIAVLFTVSYNSLLHSKDEKPLYNKEDLEHAFNDGNNAGNNYREYIEAMISNLEKDISKKEELNSQLDFLISEYDKQIEDVDKRLNETGTDLIDLSNDKITVLNSISNSLLNLKSQYLIELEKLESSLEEINIILEDFDSEQTAISGFLYAKNYIELQITNTILIINQIDQQIISLNKVIENLSNNDF